MDKRKTRFNHLKEERIGQINKNCKGDIMKIIDYIKCDNVIIEFQDEYKYKTSVSYKNFITGEVTNPYGKHVYNIGYLGNTSSNINNKTKKSYGVWCRMLQRCYDTKAFYKRPTYINCSVCDEWLCYANFEKWYDENYYEIPNEKMCLDKDILLKGNKIYSPLYCRIVPNEINCLFTKSNKSRGNYPIGVTYNKRENKFKAQLSILKNNKKTRQGLGTYNTPEEAFLAYKKAKEKYIKEVADKHKKYIPLDIYNAMYAYKVEIND